MQIINATFTLLDDVPGIFATWQKLVRDRGVSGKQIHDANHVAAMLAHGVSHILTLDERDFRRYHEVTVVFP